MRTFILTIMKLTVASCVALCCWTSVLQAQEIPADYKQVLDTL